MNVTFPPYIPRKESRKKRDPYWDQVNGWVESTTTIHGTKHYTPPEPITNADVASMANLLLMPDPYHLPPPPPGSKPPASWEEWEANANWPFPANQPKELFQKKKPEPSAQKKRAPITLQEELEINSNWPFPARKRTTSQSAPRPRTQSGTKPAEPKERSNNVRGDNERRNNASSNNARSNNANWSVRALRDLAHTMIPTRIPFVNSAATIINPLIAQNSVALVRFDLRLPYTSVRKVVRGPHWTHLNRDDLRQPATTPHRPQMRIFVQLIEGCDWYPDVRPRTREKFVTVEDVLMTVCETLNVPVDNQKWARDSVNPRLADRVLRAYRKRVEKYESTRMVGYEKARSGGLLRVDYLGSKYCFAGLKLCYGGDDSEWWMMEVFPEAR